MWRHHPADDAPVLITGAAPSLDDQHDARRRKYLVMMGLRVVCLLLAVATASTSLWLAAVFLVGGLVLPWAAVLIANDRPPKKASRMTHYRAVDERPGLAAAPSRPGADGSERTSGESTPGPADSAR